MLAQVDPDVSCNEQVKRVEITALEKYLETGKKEENPEEVEAEWKELEKEEETG